MLQQQFTQLIKQPHSIDSSQLVELEALINEYPFFESAHLLYAKGLFEHHAIHYPKHLRKAAIVANSRGILYELIHHKEITTSEKINIETTINEAIVEDTTKELIKNDDVKTEVNSSSVSVTNSDLKVIYVNTVAVTTKSDEIAVPIKDIINNDIAILKDIENETEAPIQTPVIESSSEPFNEEKLNLQIESEINRSVIQSYVETDIIKTPELNKEELNEPVSFIDWLNRVKKEGGTIQKVEVKTEKQAEISPKIEKKPTFFEQNKGIIEKIIESDPGRIKLGNQKFFTPNVDAKQSLLENEHLVTETLAKIYALQGNNSKAIRAYEILSLKFPQKSVYFATLIEKLKLNK